ncbi:hypothetical protein [Arthrobacter sp. Y-9]|uniref:hypothetical protein n=1 Tax=Arthrobacter sp. Y-9 TaxID=3039385 RepID=UPI00241EE110|nr:hypothetical protein [Arthrobacter sp. Y-9]WFR84659.1 hypothetical protein P9849_03190 [Arthrobacter sp. Y-9]
MTDQTFNRSQLADPAFYQANRAEILDAAHHGRIIDDLTHVTEGDTVEQFESPEDFVSSLSSAQQAYLQQIVTAGILPPNTTAVGGTLYHHMTPDQASVGGDGRHAA